MRKIQLNYALNLYNYILENGIIDVDTSLKLYYDTVKERRKFYKFARLRKDYKKLCLDKGYVYYSDR